jgi:glycosyltransferase involved in cell wall biosynthesis
LVSLVKYRFFRAQLNKLVRSIYLGIWRWHKARNQEIKSNLSQYKQGINIIGYFQTAKGIGEAARRSVNAFDVAQIPYSIVNYEKGIQKSIQTEVLPSAFYLNKFVYNINIIHLNPPELPFLFAKFGSKNLANRYTIGVWYWELSNMPDAWLSSFDLVDEVWVASQFVFDAVASRATVPVIKIPPCINVQYNPFLQRKDFSLPSNAFLFLCAYDVMSIQERKNPLGAVYAFKSAFDKNDLSVGLVIKVNNAIQDQQEIEHLHASIENYSNCYIINDTFEKTKMNSLINLCDVYVSLHRSEGFGLLPAEAMSLGKPVIMTKWSGNLELMTDENSCGVDYHLIQIEENQGPYLTGQYWAEPDIEHAASYMKKLFLDSDYYKDISRHANIYIKKHFSPQIVGELISSRLRDIKKWGRA